MHFLIYLVYYTSFENHSIVNIKQDKPFIAIENIVKFLTILQLNVSDKRLLLSVLFNTTKHKHGIFLLESCAPIYL